MLRIRIARDQDGKPIGPGDILLDARGRCYRVVETDKTILAQGIVSGVRRASWGRDLPPEYVRAYHAFIITERVSVDDGKRLHRERLAVDSKERREAMRLRHVSTDQTLRERGIRGRG